jgi:HSP20 family protein
MAETALTKQEGRFPAEPERADTTPTFMPRCDIRESENQVLLEADMPGVDETSVHIDLEGSELTIRGSYLPKAPKGYSPSYQEYEGGNYERTFTLGNSIDRSGIKAVVRNGVLQLRLPKAKEAQPRRITVKAG